MIVVTDENVWPVAKHHDCEEILLDSFQPHKNLTKERMSCGKQRYKISARNTKGVHDERQVSNDKLPSHVTLTTILDSPFVVSSLTRTCLVLFATKSSLTFNQFTDNKKEHPRGC